MKVKFYTQKSLLLNVLKGVPFKNIFNTMLIMVSLLAIQSVTIAQIFPPFSTNFTGGFNTPPCVCPGNSDGSGAWDNAENTISNFGAFATTTHNPLTFGGPVAFNTPVPPAPTSGSTIFMATQLGENRMTRIKNFIIGQEYQLIVDYMFKNDPSDGFFNDWPDLPYPNETGLRIFGDQYPDESAYDNVEADFDYYPITTDVNTPGVQMEVWYTDTFNFIATREVAWLMLGSWTNHCQPACQDSGNKLILWAAEPSHFSTIINCSAGTTAPTISTGMASNTCPQNTVDLDALHTGTVPANSTLVWSTDDDASDGLTSVEASPTSNPDVYYAYYYDSANDCYSPSSSVIATINGCVVPCTDPNKYADNCDFDGDGINNDMDIDDDNDGILDTEEGLTDSDGDLIDNRFDLDSDGDGCYDSFEAGVTGATSDNSVTDSLAATMAAEVGANGFANTLETAEDGVPTYSSSYANALDNTANNCQSTSPGGVAPSLTLWLKADAGTSSNTDGDLITQWEDQSNNNRHGTNPLAIRQPTFESDSASLINSNPVVYFDGSDDLSLDDTNLPTASDAREVYGVAINRFTGVSYQWIFSYGNAGNNTNFSLGEIDPSKNQLVVTGATVAEIPTAWTENIPNIGYGSLGGGNLTSTVNGGMLATTPNIPNTTLSGTGHIGRGPSGLTNFEWWGGEIAEVIFYNTKNSAIEKQRIESYLALKYGITLDQNTPKDYLASDGTTKMWDATLNTVYNNDIAGIGQDEGSDLLQKQSKSVNADGILAIGLTSIEATNIANTATFAADKNFMIWGNNNGTPDWTATGAPSDYQLLSRQWHIQETGTVGAVKMQFDVADADFDVPVLHSGTDYYLIYDSNNDGDLSDETPVALTNSSGDIWETSSNVDFADGMEFTLATQALLAPTPGGVENNLALWLKADAGGIDWTDQSGSGTSVTRNGSPAIGSMNFNPSNVFDGSQYYLTDLDINAKTKPAITAYAVHKEVTAGVILGEDDSSGDASIPNVDRVYTRGLVHISDGFSPATFLDPSPSIAAIILNEDAVNGSFAFINGSQAANFTTNHQDASQTRTYDPLHIGTQGSSWVPSLNLTGELTEVIFYEGAHSVSEREQVESYLALKYGMTLSHDYLASDGTTKMWDATANAAYSNDIAGIGQDDGSALLQKQSKSVNANGIVAMGLTSIETTNTANTATFAADKDFMLWGNNDGAATWTATGAPSDYQLLSRQWHIQETGTVGAVKMQFDVADADFDVPALITGTDYYLIYDADNDGDLSDETPVVLTNSSGDIWETSSNVDFADGMEFTLATQALLAPTPGGVAPNLALWLKADAGGIAWTDQSVNNTTVTQVGTNTLASAAINFNDAVFMGAGNHYDLTNAAFQNGTGDKSVYAVTTRSASAEGYFLTIGGSLFATRFSSMGHWGVEPGSPFLSGSGSEITSSDTDWGVGEPALVGHTYIGGANALQTNGRDLPLSQDDYSLDLLDGNLGKVGAFVTGPGSWDANLAEVIVYNSGTDTGTEKQQIESYLALKYGITIDQTTATDYLASDGSTKMWDATANATYSNDIAGIGQDEGSALLQKQSKSVNANGIVAMGLTSIETTNTANTATFAADKDFMLWGNNDGAATWTVTGAPSDYQLLSRQWHIQETGTVGAVKMQFDVADADFDVPVLHSGTDYYLIYDSNNDGDLSDETPVVLTNSSGDIWETSSNVDFADGMEFTLATQALLAPTPGGVAPNLALWLKADAGNTGINTNSQVWDDQSGNMTNAGQPIVASRPLVQENAINYNPALDFDGIDDYYDVPDDAFPNANEDYTVFIVAEIDDSNTPYDHQVISFGAGVQRQEVSIMFSDLGTINELSDKWFGDDISSSGSNIEIDVPTLGTYRYDNDGGATFGLREIFTNGWNLAANEPGGPYNIPAGLGKIGQNNVVAGDFNFNGCIAEIITYTQDMTDADRARVESYLAIKYGITLNQTTPTNYVLSDGTTIVWEATTNAAYSYDISGIARDNTMSCLHQKQSKSINSDAIVNIGNVNISTSNQLNTNDLTNQTAMIWGNNNGTPDWTATGAPSDYQLLSRQWHIQETGTVGAVKMQFDVADADFDVPTLITGTDYYLIYDADNDGDLSDETPVVLTNSSGDIWETSSNVDFADGMEFTLATGVSSIDSDGDGIPDSTDPDDDNDGILDIAETGDTDLDGIPDSLESNIIDTDGDMMADYNDNNADGEGANDGTGGEQDGVLTGLWNDTDMDGIPDHLDAANGAGGGTDITACGDSDSDGLSDCEECPGGFICPDNDGDGIPDYMDTDSDNDGIDDIVECPTGFPCTDTDFDGIADNIESNTQDTDGDGMPDYNDTNADGDSPVTNDNDDGGTGNGLADDDGDGIPNYLDAATGAGGGTDITACGDSDADGLSDCEECPDGIICPDSDGDNIPDYMDTDSDNDGIDDIAECPTGFPCTDTDSDGIADNIESNTQDTDGDGMPDYNDTNADGDSPITDDNDDGGAGNGLADDDGDGIPNYLDAANGAGGGTDITACGDSDSDGLSDCEECPDGVMCPDSDGDNIPDYMDDDSDNDGITDADECPTGFPCTDTDNDGIADNIESNTQDTDGDGNPDYDDSDADGDSAGTDDNDDGGTGNGLDDDDNDGIPNYLDAANGSGTGTDVTGCGDSDNDGLSDCEECPGGVMCPDSDNDGQPDYMQENIQIAVKVMLGGAYDSSLDLMRDDLRTMSLIPTNQPYSSLPDFNYAGSESTTASVFTVTGNDAIVDWVLIELRDQNDPTNIIQRKAALVQRDGDVVDRDGVSAVSISAAADDYYVTIRHRNHLGCMTENAISLSGTATTIDFTTSVTATYQLAGSTATAHARQMVDGVMVLWSGNYSTMGNTGNQIIFQGANSDTDAVFFAVLTDNGNTGFAPNYIVNGVYNRADGDLDGQVIFQGAGADQDVIFFSVGLFPDNVNNIPVYIIHEQIPN